MEVQGITGNPADGEQNVQLEKYGDKIEIFCSKLHTLFGDLSDLTQKHFKSLLKSEPNSNLIRRADFIHQL